MEVVVGIVQLWLNDPDLVYEFSIQTRAETRLVIHHEFAKKGYAKEAMIAVLEYTLLGRPDRNTYFRLGMNEL
jgi:RimJ/RimL family protein N-acetyltransferase